MTGGFVVVCDDDGILYGKGATAKDAWRDAEEWILDAVRQTVSDYRLGRDAPKKVFIDLSWGVHPATAALVASVGERGGHDDYRALPDGTLELGRQAQAIKDDVASSRIEGVQDRKNDP